MGELSRRKINQERCRVEGLLAVLDALVQRQAAASGGQQGEDSDPLKIFRLWHRASLHLLRLRLLAALPCAMLQEETTQKLEAALAHREQGLHKSGLPLLHNNTSTLLEVLRVMTSSHMHVIGLV